MISNFFYFICKDEFFENLKRSKDKYLRKNSKLKSSQVYELGWLCDQIDPVKPEGLLEIVSCSFFLYYFITFILIYFFITFYYITIYFTLLLNLRFKKTKHSFRIIEITLLLLMPTTMQPSTNKRVQLSL